MSSHNYGNTDAGHYPYALCRAVEWELNLKDQPELLLGVGRLW